MTKTHTAVKNLMSDADIYSAEEKDRVEQILYVRMRKYQYLFVLN